MTSKVSIGTISHGTLRTEDLLEAFADELERLEGAPNSLTLAVTGLLDEEDHDSDDWIERASYMVNEQLFDALNEFAPAHTYFGTLEGDGSDFGFWPDAGSFPDCEVHYTVEPGPLAQESAWVDLSCQIYVQVNDHGNVTVSELRGKEIWSAV